MKEELAQLRPLLGEDTAAASAPPALATAIPESKTLRAIGRSDIPASSARLSSGLQPGFGQELQAGDAMGGSLDEELQGDHWSQSQRAKSLGQSDTGAAEEEDGELKTSELNTVLELSNEGSTREGSYGGLLVKPSPDWITGMDQLDEEPQPEAADSSASGDARPNLGSDPEDGAASARPTSASNRPGSAGARRRRPGSASSGRRSERTPAPADSSDMPLDRRESLSGRNLVSSGESEDMYAYDRRQDGLGRDGEDLGTFSSYNGSTRPISPNSAQWSASGASERLPRQQSSKSQLDLEAELDARIRELEEAGRDIGVRSPRPGTGHHEEPNDDESYDAEAIVDAIARQQKALIDAQNWSRPNSAASSRPGTAGGRPRSRPSSASHGPSSRYNYPEADTHAEPAYQFQHGRRSPRGDAPGSSPDEQPRWAPQDDMHRYRQEDSYGDDAQAPPTEQIHEIRELEARYSEWDGYDDEEPAPHSPRVAAEARAWLNEGDSERESEEVRLSRTASLAAKVSAIEREAQRAIDESRRRRPPSAERRSSSRQSDSGGSGYRQDEAPSRRLDVEHREVGPGRGHEMRGADAMDAARRIEAASAGGPTERDARYAERERQWRRKHPPPPPPQ